MGSEQKKSTLVRVAGTLVKIALLGVAGWFVVRSTSWNDQVQATGGEVVSGRITAGQEPDAKSITILREDGTSRELKPGEWDPDSKKFGIRTTFRNLTPTWYALGMAMIMAMYLVGVERWRVLLEAQGIPTTYWHAFRLTFVGFFWNNFIPGMTGGDVAKAVIIAKDTPGKRSEAVSTVIVDRIIGLAMLALLSAGAILSNFETFRRQGYVVFTVLGICVIAFVCFFSRRVRRALGLNRILKALPGSAILMKLDQAFFGYRSRPRALVYSFVISLFAHLLNVGSVYVFGWDLGIPADVVTYFATVPIIFIVSSVPLAPGGWGVREAAFIATFTAVGVDPAYKSQLVLLSVLYGFSVMFYSLLGGLFLFLGRREGTIAAELRTES